MKKCFILLISLVSLSLQATTIRELFEGVKSQPITKEDSLDIKRAEVSIKSIKSKMMPKIYGIASYEHYNRPSSLRPVLPTETSTLLSQEKPLPFSKDILRIGFTFDFPLFVKSLWTLKQKAKTLKLSAKEKTKLNLFEREAKVVGANATLRHLEKLESALKAKKTSLLKTKDDISLKVQSGRSPKAALYKIEQAINGADLALNSIEQKKNEITSLIYYLSGIELNKSIDMYQIKKIKKRSFFALLPLKKALEAKKLSIKASKEALYPSLFLKANYFESYADGYNNDKSLNTGFGSIGLTLRIPLYDANKFSNIEQSRVAYQKQMLKITSIKQDISSQAKKIEKDLKLLVISKKLAKKSIDDAKKLLKVAKVSFEVGRMSEEEYLRYEDALVEKEAKLYEVESKIWQDKAALAVIYGNDLEEVIR